MNRRFIIGTTAVILSVILFVTTMVVVKRLVDAIYGQPWHPDVIWIR